MKDFMKLLVNKNTIITSNPGGGSTSLGLYITNFLSQYYNILYYDTSYSLDRNYIKEHYTNVYNNVFIIQSSLDMFIDYVTNLDSNLDDIDYIIIDTGDILGKKTLLSLYNICDLSNINLITTSQLRINPNNSKPYSTVEEWNKQLHEKPMDNSIWIRKVNEPNAFLNRKYIDIYNQFRKGNDFTNRLILNFDKKKGNII